MKKTVLTIACMYCQKPMGEKDGEGVEGVTTSICEKCWGIEYPGLPYPGTEERSHAE